MWWTWMMEPFRFRPCEGGGGLATRAVHRARRILQRFFLFVEAYWLVLDLGKEVRVPAPTIEVQMRRATERDLPLFRRKREEVVERFAQGDLCFIALHGGELAYSRWVAARPVWEGTIGMTVIPGPGEAYVYDTYTSPKYRGRGLHTAGAGYAIARLRELGYRAEIAVIASTNTPARRLAHRLGLATTEKIILIKLGGRRWIRRVPCTDPIRPGPRWWRRLSRGTAGT